MTSTAKQRQQFEKWAAEAYGGNIDKYLIRDEQNLEEYRAADVQSAWSAWCAALDSAGVRELVDSLGDMITVARGDSWDQAATGRQVILAEAESALARAKKGL